MYKIKNNPKKRRSSKKPLLLLAVLLLVGAVVFGFFSYRQRQDAATPSDEKEVIAANNDPQEATNPTKTPTTTTQKSSRDGGAVDNEGAGVTETNQSTTSESGKITVFSPVANTVVKSGSAVTGKSSLSSVSYRLMDDQIGVIATGTLKVVGGKFSGTFNFNSAGQEGRLDVYRALDDGREVDVVEIPVRYR